MQDILRQIFDMAVKELPDRYQTFHNEEAVLFKGFKISKDKDGYHWYDTRYSNYYEPVDPKVTENILENGFSFTLTEVMLHNDKDKVLTLAREIEEKDNLIVYWTSESSKLWANYNKRRKSVNENEELSKAEKDKKKASLKKRYERKKNLYQKKRRVISEERDELKADKKFFESRLKLYNN